MTLRALMAGLGLAMTMAAAEAGTITYSFTGHLDGSSVIGAWAGMDDGDAVSLTAVVDTTAPTSPVPLGPGAARIDYALPTLTLGLPDFPIALTRVPTAFPLQIIDSGSDNFIIDETFSNGVRLVLQLRAELFDLPELDGGALPTSLDLNDFDSFRVIALTAGDGSAGCTTDPAGAACEAFFVIDSVTVTVSPPPTTPTPEPAALSLLGIGLAGLWLRRRR